MAKRPRLKNASGDGKLASKSDDATGVSPAKSVSPQNGLLSNWFKPIDKEENLDSIMTVKNETLNNDKSMEVRELLQVSCGSQQLVQKPEISSDSKTPRLRQRRKVLKSVESGSESVPEVSVALNNDKIQRKDKIRFSRKVKTVFITPLPDKKPGFVRMPVSPSVTDENLMASATLINAKMPFTNGVSVDCSSCSVSSDDSFIMERLVKDKRSETKRRRSIGNLEQEPMDSTEVLEVVNHSIHSTVWLLQKSIESGESPLVQHVEARRSSRRQTAAFARNAITKMLASPDKTRFIAEKKKKNTFVDLQGSSEDTNEMKKSGNLFPLFTSKIKVVEKSVDQLNGPLSKLPKKRVKEARTPAKKLNPTVLVEMIDLDDVNNTSMSSPVVERTVEYQRANGYEYWPGNICGHVGLSSFTDAHSSYSKEFMSLPLKEHLTQAVFKPNWNLNEFDRHDHYISSCEYEAITSENISDCLIELQTEYPSVNVDRIYEQYRSRISTIQADVTTKLFVPNDKDVLENKNSRKTKRRKISNKIAGTSEIGANIIHECSSQAEDKFPIVHLPWTDTFKPNSRKDLIAYENGVVDGIYNWLRNFNDARMEKLKLDKYLRESNSDSDSDAYDYVVKNPFTPGIVVHGHTGVGKTSLVYALCTEAGFNVLELSASMGRSGAQVLKVIDGARSSHLVTRCVTDFFSGCHPKESERKSQSLILIDDVDVLFEKDDGFWPAIRNILRDCRVPVIMTCNTRFLNYLPNDLPVKTFNLNFSNQDEICCRIQLMCLLVRSFRLPDTYLRDKIASSKSDLRSLINWLQFISQPVSKPNMEIRNFIPAIEENSIVSLEEIMSLFCQLDSTAGFNDPSKLIESVSPITTDSPMGLRMFPDFPVGNNKWFDGVAQSIQSHIISAGYNFDLTGELQRQHIEVTNVTEFCNKFYPAKSEFLLRQRSVLGVDYWPFLREICKVEKLKKESGNKRRFQHYFDHHRVSVDPYELYRNSLLNHFNNTM